MLHPNSCLVIFAEVTGEAGVGYHHKYRLLILCLCCLKVAARKVIFYKFFFVQGAKVEEGGRIIIYFPVSLDLPCSTMGRLEVWDIVNAT